MVCEQQQEEQHGTPVAVSVSVCWGACLLPLVLPQARSILVTNWPLAGVPQLMESFSLFTPADSKVTFILPEEAPATWPSRLGNCRFSFTTAENPTGVKVCESLH